MYKHTMKTLADYHERAAKNKHGVIIQEPPLEVVEAVNVMLNFLECVMHGSKITGFLGKAWVKSYELRKELEQNDNSDLG